MSDNSSAAAPQGSEKSKGKQVDTSEDADVGMEEDEESSGEESGADADEAPEEPDEDNMEEIDLDNIVGGRTRGKIIDWSEAEQKSKEAGDEFPEDDDEEDDEDFVDPDDEMQD